MGNIYLSQFRLRRRCDFMATLLDLCRIVLSSIPSIMSLSIRNRSSVRTSSLQKSFTPDAVHTGHHWPV